jgi:hypothetical protein
VADFPVLGPKLHRSAFTPRLGDLDCRLVIVGEELVRPGDMALLVQEIEPVKLAAANARRRWGWDGWRIDMQRFTPALSAEFISSNAFVDYPTLEELRLRRPLALGSVNDEGTSDRAGV